MDDENSIGDTIGDINGDKKHYHQAIGEDFYESPKGVVHWILSAIGGLFIGLFSFVTINQVNTIITGINANSESAAVNLNVLDAIFPYILMMMAVAAILIAMNLIPFSKINQNKNISLILIGSILALGSLLGVIIIPNAFILIIYTLGTLILYVNIVFNAMKREGLLSLKDKDNLEIREELNYTYRKLQAEREISKNLRVELDQAKGTAFETEQELVSVRDDLDKAQADLHIIKSEKEVLDYISESSDKIKQDLDIYMDNLKNLIDTYAEVVINKSKKYHQDRANMKSEYDLMLKDKTKSNVHTFKELREGLINTILEHPIKTIQEELAKDVISHKNIEAVKYFLEEDVIEDVLDAESMEVEEGDELNTKKMVVEKGSKIDTNKNYIVGEVKRQGFEFEGSQIKAVVVPVAVSEENPIPAADVEIFEETIETEDTSDDISLQTKDDENLDMETTSSAQYLDIDDSEIQVVDDNPDLEIREIDDNLNIKSDIDDDDLNHEKKGSENLTVDEDLIDQEHLDEEEKNPEEKIVYMDEIESASEEPKKEKKRKGFLARFRK